MSIQEVTYRQQLLGQPALGSQAYEVRFSRILVFFLLDKPRICRRGVFGDHREVFGRASSYSQTLCLLHSTLQALAPQPLPRKDRQHRCREPGCFYSEQASSTEGRAPAQPALLYPEPPQAGAGSREQAQAGEHHLPCTQGLCLSLSWSNVLYLEDCNFLEEALPPPDPDLPWKAAWYGRKSMILESPHIFKSQLLRFFLV